MIQMSRGSILVLLLTSLVFLWSCASEDESATSSDGAAAASDDDSQPQDPDAGDPAGNQEGPTPEQQRAAAYVEAYLNQANRLVEAGKLAEAKDKVLAALRIDGNSEAAKAKHAEIQQMLGEGDSPKDLAQDMIKHKTAMRQRQIAEVNDRFVKAQQSYQRGELEDARKELEYADLVIRFDAYQTDFGLMKRNVADLKGEVARTIEREATVREREQFEDAFRKLKAEEEKERRQRAETIRAMMIEAIEAFERQDFDQSEHVSLRVLDLTPSYRKAKDLVEMSRQARHASWRKAYYKRRRDQMQIWKEQVRDVQVPWQDLIHYPNRRRWDEITALRAPADAAAAALEDTELIRALKNKLRTETVDWEFADQTVTEVIQEVRDTLGVNILMSKTAIEEKGEEAIDFKVRGLNFGDALSTMLSGVDLTYNFKYDMIYVVGTMEASGDVIPRVYEVRDLTIQLPDFKPPNLALRPGPAGESAAIAVFGEEGEPVRETEPEQLLDLVRDNVAPGTWDIEGRSLELSAGQLVAVTSAEVHRQVDNFLADLRRYTKVIVHVESRFINIREGFLSDIGVDIRGGGGANPGQIGLLDDVTNGLDDNASNAFDNGGAGLPGGAAQSPTSGIFFQDNNDLDFRARTENIFTNALGGFLSGTGGGNIGFTYLDDAELSVIFTAVEKSAFANVLTAPRLTIYNNQRANLTLVNQVSYVKDYDVEVAQTAFIADPLVDIVQDGLVLDVRPTVSHDRRYVTLEVRPTVAILSRPIQTFVTPLAGLTTNVIIELPEIEYRAAATTVKVPDNGWVVIGGLKNVTTVDRRSETPILSDLPLLGFFFSRKGRSDEISDLILVIHVRIIDLEEEEARLSR